MFQGLPWMERETHGDLGYSEIAGWFLKEHPKIIES
jgi:hypothetical protein